MRFLKAVVRFIFHELTRLSSCSVVWTYEAVHIPSLLLVLEPVGAAVVICWCLASVYLGREWLDFLFKH